MVMTLEYYKKWYKIEIKVADGIIAIGDVPRNWYSFEEQYFPIREWCSENINSKYYRVAFIDDGYHDTPYYIGYSFYFKFRSDAVAFKLRWT